MPLAMQGTTVIHGSTTLTGVRSCQLTDDGVEIDITDFDDVLTAFELGTSNYSVDIECIGSPQLSKGDKGTLQIAWSTGSDAVSLDNTIVQAVNRGGGLNEAKTTTYRFVPGKA